MLIKIIDLCSSKQGQLALKVIGTLMMALTLGVVVNPNDTPTWP